MYSLPRHCYRNKVSSNLASLRQASLAGRSHCNNQPYVSPTEDRRLSLFNDKSASQNSNALSAKPQQCKSAEHPRRHFVLPIEAPPLCRKRDVTSPGERGVCTICLTILFCSPCNDEVLMEHKLARPNALSGNATPAKLFKLRTEVKSFRGEE